MDRIQTLTTPAPPTLPRTITRPQFEALRTAEPIAEWQDLPESHPLACLKQRYAVVAQSNTIKVLMRLGLVEIAEGDVSEATGRPFNQINALTPAGEVIAAALKEGGELPTLDHITHVVKSGVTSAAPTIDVPRILLTVAAILDEQPDRTLTETTLLLTVLTVAGPDVTTGQLRPVWETLPLGPAGDQHGTYADRLIAAATDSDPNMDEALRRARAPRQVATFDDGSDACPLCGYWACRCGTQHTGRGLTVAM